MKIVGRVPGWGYTFDGMIERLVKKPSLYVRLLKTWRASGYFTNNMVFTKMGFDEKRRVNELAALASESSELYAKTVPLNLPELLPKLIGVEVQTAQYVGRGKEHCMVMLKGPGRDVMMESRIFKTLQGRHPTAAWFFGVGKQYWERPILLLEAKGIMGGEVLGMAMPVPLSAEDLQKLPCKDPNTALKKLTSDRGILRYVPVKKSKKEAKGV